MIDKDSLEVLAQRANSLYQSGAYQEAREPLLNILKLQPQNDSVMHMLAFAEHQEGKNDKALSLLNDAIAINPNNMNCYNLKGYLCAVSNDFKGAEECYLTVLHANPDLPGVQKNLGMVYVRQQQWKQALSCFGNAVMIDQNNLAYKQLFASISMDYTFSEFNDDTKKIIELCLEEERLTHKFIETNWINILHNHSDFSMLREVDPENAFQPFLDNENISELISTLNKLYFLLGLRRFYLTSIHYEKILTALRKCILKSICDEKENVLSEEHCNELLPFIQSLAIQCWQNEYVYSLSDEEDRLIKNLRKNIESKGASFSDFVLNISIFSCYEPLHSLKNIEELVGLLGVEKNEIIAQLIKLQVSEPLEEREIRKSIPIHGSIDNKVSQNVREQYEENPYPRWKTVSANSDIGKINSDKIEILIAGCGTGMEPASMTQLYPNANFTCVDLSLSSLAYAIRQCGDLNLLDQMNFMQADILELGSLDKKFDIIYSSGVLHHMDDPEAGLKVLQSLIKDDGVMNIAVYSEVARPHVIAARYYIAKENMGSSAQNMRYMREVIMDHPDEVMRKCMSAGDFFTLSQCRDLIFHVQEHRFTIPKIKDLLERNNLLFLGFFDLSQYKVQQFQERFSDENAHQNLDCWEIFEKEQPDLFINKMYKITIGLNTSI